MRGRLAAIAGASTILLILIALFLSAPPTWRNGESRPSVAGHYPYIKPDPLPWDPPKPKEPSGGKPIERLIVKVKLSNEDDSWLDSLFPTWRKEVITIDHHFSNLHPDSRRVDKGRIASAYLTWIIENYHSLPSTTVFLQPAPPAKKQPAHQALFRKPAPPTANMQQDLEALQTSFIQTAGFANLHCPAPATCADLTQPFHATPREFRTLDVAMPRVWENLFGKEIHVPEALGTAPSAEFAVSKEQVLKRRVDEYVRYWSWLNRTVMDDDSAGLVFEHLWHVIFGRENVFCPEEGVCRCEVYGRCGEEAREREKGTSWW